MSRYTIPSFQPDLTCAVGWDPPLGTFFGQVFQIDPPRHESIFWIGADFEEVPSLDELMNRMTPYCTLTTDMQAQLLADKYTAGYRPNVGSRILKQLQQLATKKES